MTLLVATDFSEGAATALNYASVQPDAKDGLHVVHVVDSFEEELWTLLVQPPVDLEERLIKDKTDELSSWTYGAFMDEDVDLNITFHVAVGRVWDGVASFADELKPSRVICGSVGKSFIGGSHRIGTNALRIAMACSVPVTVVESANSLHPSTFLVPYDFSARSEAVLNYAVSRAKAADAKLHIVNALPIVGTPSITAEVTTVRDQTLDSRRRLLENKTAGLGVECELEFSFDPPHLAIIDASHRLLDTEVIMATRGRGPLLRMALGSVTERVLRDVDRPVTIFPVND